MAPRGDELIVHRRGEAHELFQCGNNQLINMLPPEPEIVLLNAGLQVVSHPSIRPKDALHHV